MAQATTRIEDVWDAKGNLPLAPAILDSNGGLTVDHFNYPNLTTSELDAVTDATEGDVYFDTDRGQFVRFTGAASYDVITSRTFEPTLHTTAGADLTLETSRLFESGTFAGSADVNFPDELIAIGTSKNPAAFTPDIYLYHTGEQAAAGWYTLALAAAPNVPFTPDTLIQSTVTGADSVPYMFNNYITNSTTEVILATQTLEAGTTYEIDFQVSYLDLALDNFRLSIEFSGLYEESGYLRIINKDTLLRSTLLDLSISAPDETTTVSMGLAQFVGVAGSHYGIWNVKGVITPSSDGTLVINARQTTANVDHLLYSTPSMTITALSD